MTNFSTNGPIFVIGMNGSGTTMLSDCLNNHSKIYSFWMEANFIPYYIETHSKYGDLNDDKNFLGLLNAIRNEPVLKAVNGYKAVPLPSNWRSCDHNLTAATDIIFNYFASLHHKPIWCIKAPSYAKHVLQISKYFPNSKFIHIMRDGRDCAASLHRRWKYNSQAMIYRWKKYVGEANRQGRILGKDKYIECFYENLTRNPEKEMQKICSFLQVEYEKNILESSRIRNFTGSKSKVLHVNSNKFKIYFTPQKIYRLEKIAGEQLHKLGYSTDLPYSDYDPPTFLITLLTYYGYAIDRICSFHKRGLKMKWKIAHTFRQLKHEFKK